MARRSLLLGLDGGTNRSVAIISDDAGAILARREDGALDIAGRGLDASGQAAYALVVRCCDDARCKPADLNAMVIGIGGAEREIDRSRFLESCNALFMKNGGKRVPLAVESHSRIALEGAFDGGEGVLIVAGTGSVVVGKTRLGELVSIGGWGNILGDEGGGYFIGREALMALVQECEHRGSAGRLREVFGSRFHFGSREQIISAIYQDKFDIAALAPVVMETAASNDLVAQRILDHAAMLLADQARIIVMQMGLLRKVRLAMVGSLVEGNTIYANALHMKILKILPQVEVRPPLHEPAYGAMLLAVGRLQKA